MTQTLSRPTTRIHVITRSERDPDRATRKDINLRDPSDKRWLVNHLLWAVTNAHSVTIHRHS